MLMLSTVVLADAVLDQSLIDMEHLEINDCRGHYRGMTFWDIAAGILVAAFIITAVAKGLRERGEKALGVIGAILAAALIIWRSSCWYWDVKCDAHLGSHPTDIAADSHQ